MCARGVDACYMNPPPQPIDLRLQISSFEEPIRGRITDTDGTSVEFTGWIERNAPDWQLMRTLPNRFPAEVGEETDRTSFADFYFFVRSDEVY